MTLTAATLTVTSAGMRAAPLIQTSRFLRRVPPDGQSLRAVARVTDADDRMVLTALEITDAHGSVVVRADQSAILRPRRGAPAAPVDRVLTTVMLTDIVGSTRLARDLGDARWNDVLAEHHAVVRRLLALHKGREIKTTGDGFLATFDSPTRAVRCAAAIRDGLHGLGLEVRIGLHTGECDFGGGDVAGVAVHVASRLEAAAQPGQILVTSTVNDVVAGSGLHLADAGVRTLKDLDGEWKLFAVE
jgi:class 3 adenylate cyclase